MQNGMTETKEITKRQEVRKHTSGKHLKRQYIQS